MLESIYNTEVLQLGVKLNQLFHGQSGKINRSLSLRHSLAAERGGARAPAPAPAGLGGGRGRSGSSRRQPGIHPGVWQPRAPAPRRCEGSTDSTAGSDALRLGVRPSKLNFSHLCTRVCVCVRVWVNHLKVKEKTHNNSDEIKFQKGGGKINVHFAVTSESFVEMLNLGSILHKNNKEYLINSS